MWRHSFLILEQCGVEVQLSTLGHIMACLSRINRCCMFRSASVLKSVKIAVRLLSGSIFDSPKSKQSQRSLQRVKFPSIYRSEATLSRRFRCDR
mmetsp:Transcript_1464/g.1950  ORF Transcript_1464/g.1950 Transcript_1464/m.1950 type:complete len:94 (+) Transcript_1464:299-580(+)